MSTTRRKFTREFKQAAVKRLQSGYPVGRVVRELEVNPNQLHAWRRQFEELCWFSLKWREVALRW